MGKPGMHHKVWLVIVIAAQFSIKTPQLCLLAECPMPKSGTTLMRVVLDIHSGTGCGPETHVIIDGLKLRYESAFGKL